MGLLLIPCRLDHFNNFKVSFFFLLLKFIIIISTFIRQAIMNVWIYYLIIYVLLTLIELIILRFIFYFLHLIPPLFHFLPISHLYYLYYLYDLILYNFLLTFNANFQFFYSIIGLMIFVKVKYQLSLAYDKLKIYLIFIFYHDFIPLALLFILLALLFIFPNLLVFLVREHYMFRQLWYKNFLCSHYLLHEKLHDPFLWINISFFGSIFHVIYY